MALYPQGEAEGQEGGTIKGGESATGTLHRSRFRSLIKRGILTCSPGTKRTCGLFHSESCTAVAVQTRSHSTDRQSNGTAVITHPVGVFILLATVRLKAGTSHGEHCTVPTTVQSPPIDVQLKFPVVPDHLNRVTRPLLREECEYENCLLRVSLRRQRPPILGPTAALNPYYRFSLNLTI